MSGISIINNILPKIIKQNKKLDVTKLKIDISALFEVPISSSKK